MPTTRRRFLQSSLGSSALLSWGLAAPRFLARAAAAASQNSVERILVVVQLSGGNDGLNTVIPYGDEAYARNRIVLRIPTAQILKIDGQIGLHPGMTGMSKLLEENRLAIVQGVGYPNPDRSHFRSMDIWHSAQPETEKPRDGWLGRYVESTGPAAGQDVPALHLGGNELPLALLSQQRPVPSVESLANFRLRTAGGAASLAALQELASTPRSGASPLLTFVQQSTLNAYASSQQIQQAVASERSPVDYPGFGLAQKLRGVAQLIDAGMSTRIYYLALDGFDTHANQAEAHAALLNELSQSLAAFAADLRHRGHLERTLVMAFSEFGRRVHENASFGTDHGAAAPLFLVGESVRPGLIGKHPSLTDLDREGDLKFHTDFRQVYAAILHRWLGCQSDSILGRAFEPVNIVRG